MSVSTTQSVLTPIQRFAHPCTTYEFGPRRVSVNSRDNTQRRRDYFQIPNTASKELFQTWKYSVITLRIPPLSPPWPMKKVEFLYYNNTWFKWDDFFRSLFQLAFRPSRDKSFVDFGNTKHDYIFIRHTTVKLVLQCVMESDVAVATVKITL